MNELTKADISNGWTTESLAAYRRERDNSFPDFYPNGKFNGYSGSLVAGNVVTEYKRPKAAIQIQSADRSFNPHKW